MGGRIPFGDFLTKFLPIRLRRDTFIVLDVGTFSVKGLVVEIEKGEKSGRVIASSNRYHVGGDMNSDGSFNIEGVIATSRSVINELRRQVGPKAGMIKDTVLGIGGGFVLGKTLAQTYIRESPQEEIDARELDNIIQKVQQRNFEQIRRDFHKDTGRSELDVHIVNSAVLEIKIDGYQIVNPVGFRGKEISCSVFNSYLSKSYYALLLKLIAAIGLNLRQITAESYAVFNTVLKHNSAIGDFILIDIGGNVTEIALTRKGKLEDMRSIALGGSSFTGSIAERLKIGFWEAENIKRKFSKGDVSGRVRRLIEEIILRDVELLLHGLELVLVDMSQVSLLPSSIYLYGGGSAIPLLNKILGKKDWRESLSFFSRPVIADLPALAIIHFPPDLCAIHWHVSLSLADLYISEGRKEDDLTKVVNRSLRLIQGT